MSEHLKFILLSIFAYLLGSVPFGYIVGKINRVDVLQIGSHSASSTNVSRALGWRWATISAALDFSKGLLPSYLARISLSNQWLVVIVSLLPMVGQVFPIFLRFRGGKGASTYYGAISGLIGLHYFILFFPALPILLLITRRMSLTNIIFSWLLTIAVFLFSTVIKPNAFPISYAIFALIGAIFMLIAMRENIDRLIKNKEPETPLKW
ncbi:MAG: glycerol-3-phosphate acyltransferase [Caldisericum sp.]|uniref:glycerol-3-phosphate acyltransferase n=1 Tax=Caldisericum sp. TaxID=2499687 RepID=UPI003D14AC29